MKADSATTALTRAVKPSAPGRVRRGSSSAKATEPTTETTDQQRPPHQRAFSRLRAVAATPLRLRFRMRTLLAGMTVVSLAVGLWAAENQRHAMAIEAIQNRGGVVAFDSWHARGDMSPQRLLAATIGPERVRQPLAVIFPAETSVTDEDLRLLSRLGSVRLIHLDGHRPHQTIPGVSPCAAVTDRGLAYLQRLPRLHTLTLRGSAVTPAGIASFREQRPECYVANDPQERLAFFRL